MIDDTLAATTLPVYTAYLRAQQLDDPRSRQSQAGLMGPSDVGFCRQKALLMLKGTPQSDSKNMWAAEVGKAIHERLLRQFKEADPVRFLTETDDLELLTVPINLGDGIEIVNPGHPDLVDLDLNMVVDIKTVDGLGVVKRNGASTQQKWQRWQYAKGLIDAGILDRSKPVYTANLWFDRSGAEPNPHMEVELFDDTTLFGILEWISDVIYARQHDEDASRDVAAPVCERICEFFTVCRGSLPDEDGKPITDENVVAAVRAYADGLALAKEAEAMKKAAKATLEGVSGIADGWQIRWVHVNPSEVAASTRAGYDKISVVPARVN